MGTGITTIFHSDTADPTNSRVSIGEECPTCREMYAEFSAFLDKWQRIQPCACTGPAPAGAEPGYAVSPQVMTMLLNYAGVVWHSLGKSFAEILEQVCDVMAVIKGGATGRPPAVARAQLAAELLLGMIGRGAERATKGPSMPVVPGSETMN
jgi:hypothetical protein